MRIGCILMAAGYGRRFSANKLLTDFRGKPLIQYALEAPPPELPRAVVSQYPEILALGAARGFLPLHNRRPREGQSFSIRLGIGAFGDVDGLMFMVGDQPLLRRESLEGALALFRAKPQSIVALSHGERRGNPVIFPQALFGELLALRGDTGGRAVIRAHRDSLLLYPVEDEGELMDVDSPEQFESLRR